MDTRRFALWRRALFVAAVCLPIGLYVGMPSGFLDAFSKVGEQAQTPLEALAVEQIAQPLRPPANPSRAAPGISPKNAPKSEPHHPAIWESGDAPAARASGRDQRDHAPGVVRSIRYEDFKHWT